MPLERRRAVHFLAFAGRGSHGNGAEVVAIAAVSPACRSACAVGVTMRLRAEHVGRVRAKTLASSSQARDSCYSVFVRC